MIANMLLNAISSGELRRYEYHHDIAPLHGSFLRVVEWTVEGSDVSTGVCSDDIIDDDTADWESDFSGRHYRVLPPATSDGGDNTATPQEQEGYPTSHTQANYTQDCDNQVEGGNTATPDDSPSQEEFLQMGLNLMQSDLQVSDLGEREEDGDRQSISVPLTLVVSDMSDAPPPVGPGVNREVDWLSSWVRARSSVTEYYRYYRDLGDTHAPVHIVYSALDGTFSYCVRCPGQLLSIDQQIEYFIRWCAQQTGRLSQDCSRVFCTELELYQNVPSLIIVQEQPTEQMPLLVQVTDQSTALYLVYQAYAFERVAGIIDWANWQVDIVLPFEVCYMGHRVLGGQDVQISAGCILQIRVRSWRENQAPLTITTASAPSLTFETHSTWDAGLQAAHDLSPLSRQVPDELLPLALHGSTEAAATLHTLEPLRPWHHGFALDEEDDETLFFQTLQRQREESNVLEISGVEELDHSEYERHWIHYAEWRRHVRQLLRATFSFGLQRLQEEALAFKRARQAWPTFVVVALPDVWYRGTPTVETPLDVEGIVVYIREFLFGQHPQDFPLEQSMALCAVFPHLTPYEQNGEDSLYLILDPLQTPGIPVLILEDHWSQDEPIFWPLKLPMALWTDDLLRTLGRLEECQEETATCILTHDGYELPRLVAWRGLPGMKLNLWIRHDDRDECPYGLIDDETFLMQIAGQDVPAAGPGDRGPRRQESDSLYDLVQRESGPSIVPTGGIAKFWLIPGEGVALHDAVIRLDLRPQVPDWTGWVAQSWRMAPTMWRFLLVRGRIPSISREQNDFLFLGTGQRDVEQGMRALLVDLRFSSVLRRGAIRCGILATVAEITRFFTNWQIPIDSPLLATFQLHWHDGATWRIFTAFETPTVPEGSFVQIVQASTSCTSRQLISPPDPFFLERILQEEAEEQNADSMSLMQSLTRSFEGELLRGANDPLFRVVQGLRRHLPQARTSIIRVHLWWFESRRTDVLFEARVLELTPDETDWMAVAGLPGDATILPVLPRPTGNLVLGQLHLMAYSEGAFRRLLVDLVLLRGTKRTAVQCRTTSTVLDIFRIIAKGRPALWALQTTSFVMDWTPPEGIITFQSYEKPQVPSGSYVVLRIEPAACMEYPETDRLRQTEGARYIKQPNMAEVSSPDHDDVWGDNTATPPTDDMHSFMQLTAEEVSTIRWARVVHAFSNHLSMNEVISFSAQNFVRKDGLRQWVDSLLPPMPEGRTQLAIWRLGPRMMVAKRCDYVVLETDNWSKAFREYWRVQLDAKVPDLAAPEPQPLSLSGSARRQLHVIAFEHNKMPLDTVIHLFEVWMTESPAEGTGRTFVARLAAAVPRRFRVAQIVEALGLATLTAPNGQAFILFSLRDGIDRAIFWQQNVPEVPDFSLLHIILVQRNQDHCDKKSGENTATPMVIEDDGEVATVFLQTRFWTSVRYLAEPTVLGRNDSAIGLKGGGRIACCNLRPCLDEDLFWKKSPCAGLSPPGNPVTWANKRFDCLDDIVFLKDDIVVLDYLLGMAPAVRRPREAQRQKLSATVSTVTAPHFPISLCLAECLPLPTEDEQAVPGRLVPEQQSFSVRLPDFGPLLEVIFAKRPIGQVNWQQLRHDLPQVVWEAFDSLVASPRCTENRLCLYTDGSWLQEVPGNSSAWAFVVIGQNEADDFLVDYDYGLVVCDPLEEGWTGAAVADSRAAETAALIRAIEWALNAGIDVPHTFLFDAAAVGFAGAGFFRTDAEDRHGRILRAMVNVLERFFPANCTVEWRHVKGHQGNLGNEMADTLAKHCCRLQLEREDVRRPDYAPYACGKRYAVEYLWMLFEHMKMSPAFPEIIDNALQFPKLRNPASDEVRMPTQLLRPVKVEEISGTFSVTVATYNVATLGGKRGPYAVQYLREQMRSHALDILCLQETRSKAEAMVISTTHFRLVSAADQGRGGTEIWLARHDTRGKPLFAKELINVLISESELQIVKATCKGVALLIVNGHAPHSGHDTCQIQEYWKRLENLLKTFASPTVYIVGGVDANAHFGEPAEGYVGDYGIENKTDLGGACFKAFLMCHDLFIPSSYEHIHSGDTDTWHHPVSGGGARCDYIFLPRSWFVGDIQTYPLHTLDLAQKGDDHTPLAASVKILLTKERRTQAGPVFDRRRLQQATAEEVAKIFEGVTIPSWDTDIDEHMTALTEQICQRLPEVFPKESKGPRRGYITDESWELRRQRIHLRHQLSRTKLTISTLSLRDAWNCLRHGFRSTDVLAIAFRSFVKAVQQKTAIAECTKQLQASLRHDRVRSLERLAEQSHDMNPRDFMGSLRALGVANAKKPTAIQPMPLLKNDQGEPLDTVEKVRDCWREYFREQEDGVASDFRSLFKEADAVGDRQESLPEWGDLPTIFQIEQFFRRTSKGKAFFGDGIPGELLAQAPKQMAQLLFTCLCKEIAYVREPLAHKGGYLIPAFKKGDPSVPSNYRSLFVSSVIGKAIHALYRQELAEVFGANRLPFQIGGLRGHGITQAAHALQAFQRQAIQRKHSVCFLFLDVANAFYRLARQHIIHGTGDARDPQQLFQALGLPEQAFAEFERLVKAPGALEMAEAPEFLKRLFREFYHQTWFTLRNDDQVIETRRGSRPGDSFADLCFSFALTKVLQPVMEAIRQRFPELGLSWDGCNSPVRSQQPLHRLDVLMPIWADDLAVALSDPHPTMLLEKAREVTGMILDGVLSAGLVPNLRPGKTELLIDFRGKGAQAIRRELYHAEYLLKIPSNIEDYQLRTVGAYKHLGTWLQSGAGIAKDLAMKFAVAHDLVTKYRATIFANRKMPLEKKRQLFEMMIMSTIIFNAAVWCPRNKRQAAQTEAAFMRLYKRVTALHFGQQAVQWSQTRILNAFGLPDPAFTIRRSRLRYLLQLAQVGQPHTWALLQTDDLWKQQVNEDLSCLNDYCPEDEVPFPIEEYWNQLIAFMLESPGRWKKILKKMIHRHISIRQIDCEWNAWHSAVMQDVLESGFGHRPQRVVEAQQHYCLACRQTFVRRSALTVHAFKKHGRVNQVRDFVQGTQCERCLRVYDRYTDLVNHVKRSTACFDFYKGRRWHVARQPGVNSRQENRNRRDLRAPVLQAEGPQCAPPPPFEEEAQIEQLELWQAWDTASSELSDPDQWLDRLRTATLTTWLYHEEILQCFSAWWERWCHDNQTCRLSDLVIHGRFTSLASAAWFLHGDLKERYIQEDPLQFFEREAWIFNDVLWSPPKAIKYFPRVVAHLFSGERRKGDVQAFLEAAGFEALSIDVVFDLEWGNLLRPETLALFQRSLRERTLLGFIAGPPCETWSRARAVVLAGRSNGPRVVRSRYRLQGIKSLNRKEAQQVSIGNQLLGVTLVLVWSAIVHGATAVVEHPAQPEEETLPSIWHLPVIAFFLRFQCCKKIRIEQGRFGGLSPKPTDLLVVHGIDDVAGFFVQHRTTPLPQTSRIGKDEDGSWRTSVLKRYPPDLCKALALLFNLSQPEEEVSEEIPSWFAAAVDKLKAHFSEEAVQGPDYCPRAARGDTFN